MAIKFQKYHGAGNDFIMIDDREKTFPEKDYKLVEDMCMRRFGIGADGLILIRPGGEGQAFDMVYYNADGQPGSMCGNGARCAVQFARKLQLFDKRDLRFTAVDGPHLAWLTTRGVRLQMGMPTGYRHLGDKNYFVDTGSPHYVRFLPNEINLEEYQVYETGRKIRYSGEWKDKGTNVNFVQERASGLTMRTYERGVEDETLACGTGVTAAAWVLGLMRGFRAGEIHVSALGGDLVVHLVPGEPPHLEGPAQFVFAGEWSK